MRTLMGLLCLVGGAALAGDTSEEPVRHWALVEGEPVLLVKLEDGWHEENRTLGGAFEPGEFKMLSDPTGKVRDGVRDVKKSYRGAEGWQSLRWGMTKAEAAPLVSGTKLKPRTELMEGLAWATTVAGRKARVSCMFADDRLSVVLVSIPSVDREWLSSLLVKKYGDPAAASASSAQWRTKESGIIGEWSIIGGGTIIYASKVFAAANADAVERLRTAQADDI